MTCVVIGLTWATLVAGAEDTFDRYRIILERQPFGEPPPPPSEPAESPAEEAPPWAESYRLCSVYQDSDERVRVALLNLKTNKPVILSRGDGSAEGIELLDADVNTEEARLRKDGEAFTMKLEASSQPAAAQTATARPDRTERVRRVTARNESRTAVRPANRKSPLAVYRRNRQIRRRVPSP